jgi:hypothetical protein
MRARSAAWAALSLLAILVLAPAAQADDKLRQSSVVWKAVDKCTRAAAKAYPDYTAESLAKRAAHRRLCLRQNNLPGGDDAPVAPAASAAGDVGK